MKINLKTVLKIGLPTILLIIILGYGYLKTRDLFRGVKLTVETLEDGQIVNNPVLLLKGSAKKAVYLSINDREIFLTPDENFQDSLLLLPGYNIITLKARDKFGREKEDIYRVILE